MRKDPRQFGSFDGLDNRRTVAELFASMGTGPRADQLRANVIKRFVAKSDQGFRNIAAMVQVTPLDAVSAYNAFIAVTGVLGVEIEAAAIELEQFVRGHETESLAGLVVVQ